MLNSTENRNDKKAEQQAQAKARRRAEQASIVEGLRTSLDEDEQLLAFARGRLAGGWRGKLLVGPEAFFAPYINIGLTERRLILQHIHPENGKPSEILPHFFPLADIATISFTDIETFGAEPACRLILRLNSEQHFRIRLDGASDFESAQTLAEVFQSLMSAHRTTPHPTRSVCASCGHALDQPFRFCPYCGQPYAEAAPTATAPEPQAEEVVTPTSPAPVDIVPETPVESVAEPSPLSAETAEVSRPHPVDLLPEFAAPVIVEPPVSPVEPVPPVEPEPFVPPTPEPPSAETTHDENSSSGE